MYDSLACDALQSDWLFQIGDCAPPYRHKGGRFCCGCLIKSAPSSSTECADGTDVLLVVQIIQWVAVEHVVQCIVEPHAAIYW